MFVSYPLEIHMLKGWLYLAMEIITVKRSHGRRLTHKISVLIRSDSRVLLSLSLQARKGFVNTLQYGSHLQAMGRDLRMESTHLTPWSWFSHLPELWEINFCYLNHPICGILLLQLRLTHTTTVGIHWMWNWKEMYSGHHIVFPPCRYNSINNLEHIK